MDNLAVSFDDDESNDIFDFSTQSSCMQQQHPLQNEVAPQNGIELQGCDNPVMDLDSTERSCCFSNSTGTIPAKCSREEFNQILGLDNAALDFDFDDFEEEEQMDQDLYATAGRTKSDLTEYYKLMRSKEKKPDSTCVVMEEDPAASSSRKRRLDEKDEGDWFGSTSTTNPFSTLYYSAPLPPTPSPTDNLKQCKKLRLTENNGEKLDKSSVSEWVQMFENWSHAEKVVAINMLVGKCDNPEIRHIFQVIEPFFQRDFISLLPKELALYVLSYLGARDLLRASQTCKAWQNLADDNILWKEKCVLANIELEHVSSVWKPPSLPYIEPTKSPYKAAFLRQRKIEMNWRINDVKESLVLKGHDDHVITCLQFCGNRIVSGSDDNTLKVWSVTTGKCLRTLTGHTGGVWSSQMNGTTIVSGSTDRTLKIWDAESGECRHTLYGHTSTVRCMCLNGNIVVSGSRDTTLRMWDIGSGECLHTLIGHVAAVRCVQYDGRLVVSGAYDYTVKVWDPETEICLHTLTGHTNRVYSLQFDGVHVVSGSLDTSIKVWDVETGELKHTLTGHQSLTSGMELKNNILVSGNADSTVKVWDIITGRCLQTLCGPRKHQSAVTCLQFNSRFVITSSDDGTVKLWDVKTGEFIRDLVTLDSGGSGGVVWRLRSNDTKLVCAVGSRNGTEDTKLLVLDFDT